MTETGRARLPRTGSTPLLLGCFRVAWVCCTVAVAAMLPALVLRSTAFVAVFEIGLACCFTALGAATLVAVLLADLLDRD